MTLELFFKWAAQFNCKMNGGHSFQLEELKKDDRYCEYCGEANRARKYVSVKIISASGSPGDGTPDIVMRGGDTKGEL